MQVFKLFFKIVWRNLPTISIYLFVFLALSILFSSMGPSSDSAGFESARIHLAIFNEDGDAALARGLDEYLRENTAPTALGDDIEAQRDALFYREAEYILTIPAGFSESFLSGDGLVVLEKMAIPNSSSDVQVEFLINRYLGLARTYAAALSDASPDALIESVAGSLQKTADAHLIDANGGADKPRINYYFTYFPYSVMSIMILAITSVMLAFGATDIRRRNAAAPMANLSLNLQLVCGSLLFSLFVWGLLSLAGALMYPESLEMSTFPMLLLNALVCTMVCLSLSFLLGNLVKNRNTQSAVSNVVSMGLCFISGVFVPQEFLGSTVQKIASFTPIHWYVRVVNMLAPGAAVSEAMGQAARALLIQAGFALAFLAIALAIARHKSIERT